MRNRKWSLGVALVVAYALAAQSLLFGFSAAAQALSSPRDVFGNVLCAPSSGDHATPDQSSDHADRTQCCTLACGAAGPLNTPPATVSSISTPSARDIVVAFLGTADQIVAPRFHTPHNSRAPPYLG